MVQSHSHMLAGKDEELKELYDMCNNEQQQALVKELLKRFKYVDDKAYAELLRKASNFIKSLGYKAAEMCLLAITIDENADSSQAVLQDMKVTLGLEMEQEIETCNHMDNIMKLYSKGCRHFIAVDEFAGSGSTIANRNNRFLKAIRNLKDKKDVTIDFCILAGMEQALQRARQEDISLYIAEVMGKGISDHYSGDRLAMNTQEMVALEGKLAEKIKNTELRRHNFGYGQAESLYYKANGNIPNNVFPIFWWKEYRGNKKRKALFTRIQNDY